MNTPPAVSDLSPEAIGQKLALDWNLEGAELSYVPLGFGSHHWLAEFPGRPDETLFVTADAIEQSSDAADALRRSLTTAWDLHHRAGIREVVSALPTATGELLAQVNLRWLMAVFPYLPLHRAAWGAFRDEADRLQALRLMARIHGAGRTLDLAGPPVRETFEIPHREALFGYLDGPGTAWRTGPYGEATRQLLRDHAGSIKAGFARYDHLAALALSAPNDWVVTHGEPHAGNILRRVDTDEMAIVDWDTCAFAPRERDLWQLFRPDSTSLDDVQEYLATAGLDRATISADRLALYRLRWDLAEIAIYAWWFANQHDDSEDMSVGWGGLQSSVALLPGHLAGT